MARQENTFTTSDPDDIKRMFLTAYSTGEYLVCFGLKQPIPDSYCRLSPKVYFGESGDPRITSRMGAQLHEISTAVASNNNRVGDILEELKLQTEREKLFRAFSNTLHRNVYWLALLQVVVLGLTAYWQTRYLKNFFKAKKLV